MYFKDFFSPKRSSLRGRMVHLCARAHHYVNVDKRIISEKSEEDKCACSEHVYLSFPVGESTANNRGHKVLTEPRYIPRYL